MLIKQCKELTTEKLIIKIFLNLSTLKVLMVTFLRGNLGMEHGNSIKRKEGKLAVISAFKESDNLLK